MNVWRALPTRVTFVALALGLAGPAPSAAQSPAPFPRFEIGIEYTEPGLAAAFSGTGVTWAKTRLEAFAWGAVEPAAPVGGVHTYDWSCTDALVAEYQVAGFVNLQSYISTVSPWGSVSVSEPAPKLETTADYAAFITALVERYDGDGEDDMPGLLAPIRFWVVGGEWSGYWASGNAANYLATLQTTRQAALAADPSARLGLIPFVLWDVFEGNEPTALLIALRLANPFASWRNSTASMLALLDRVDLYDYVDVHSLGDATELGPMLDWFRAQLASRNASKPIWVDDAYPMGLLVNCCYPLIYPMTADRQDAVRQALFDIADLVQPAYGVAIGWVQKEIAASLVRKVVTAAGEGATGIQIGNTEDWMLDSEVSWREFNTGLLGAAASMGLVDVSHPAGYDFCDVKSSGAPRPPRAALALVAQRLAGFTTVERIAGPGLGLWAFRFEAPGGWFHVAWREDGVQEIPGETEAKVQEALPAGGAWGFRAYRTPVDASGIHETRLLASGGSIHLPLDSVPVFLVPEPPGVSGDVDGDGDVDVADIFSLINFLFAGGPVPHGPPDASGDGDVDVADVFYLVNYLFAGGPPPV